MLEELIRYVLPKEVINYFELSDIKTVGEELHLYLDELNIVPGAYEQISLSSNGFYEESLIRDFPLRDKKYYFMYVVGVGHEAVHSYP
ncbi:MAG: hypothetical protein LBJ01_12005 [Tannerella sp.]|jgi:hypothetical protein|nr:hypothetical protein [Tannerella sp.]